MIRINLLGQDRQKKKSGLSLLDPSRRAPVGATLIVLAAAGGVGWWYWSLDQTSKRLDVDIASAQAQANQMKPVLAEVQRFEARRTQLQQRVAVIEQLRGGQSVPVQLLDAVSKSVPDMLWLTQLDQQKGEMTIEGRSTTLIALSDFVGNLGASGMLQKPIEIVSSQVEALQGTNSQLPPTDVIKFTVKAQLVAQAEPAPAAAAPAAGGAR